MADLEEASLGGDVVLELQDVSRRFGAVRALTDVGFDCRAGEVHAVVGENGSGKSTLLGIASGFVAPDLGTVRIGGHPQLGRTSGSGPAVGSRYGLPGHLPGPRGASATNMVQRSILKGLLKYEKYRGLVLTPSGARVARKIAQRHRLLTDFLSLLGLDEQVIHHDVEGMEHHISAPTLRAIEALTRQLRRRPSLRRQLRTAAA